jgi:hypothetical protein
MKVTRLPFDMFKVHKVAEYYGGNESMAYCETIDDAAGQQYADDEASSQFWTVYGWRRWPENEVGEEQLLPGYGTTAIADLTDHESALDLAIALAGGDETKVEDMG